MSPGFLLQFVKQLLSNDRIGKGHFELWPGAGDHLDQVGATYDANEIAFLVDDGTRLIRRSSNNVAISCSGISGVAVTTSVVITSLTFSACDLA